MNEILDTLEQFKSPSPTSELMEKEERLRREHRKTKKRLKKANKKSKAYRKLKKKFKKQAKRLEAMDLYLQTEKQQSAKIPYIKMIEKLLPKALDLANNVISRMPTTKGK